jgi:hypothetical protein
MNKCGVAVSVWRTRRDVDLCIHFEVPASLQHGPPSGNIVMCTTAAETSWVAQRVGGLQSSATEKVEDTGRPGSRKTYANDRKPGEAGGVRRERQEERPAQHASSFPLWEDVFASFGVLQNLKTPKNCLKTQLKPCTALLFVCFSFAFRLLFVCFQS